MTFAKKNALVSVGLIVALGSSILTSAAPASARQLSDSNTIETTLVASATQARSRKSRTSTSSYKQIDTCTIPTTMTIHNRKGRKIKTLKKGTSLSFDHKESEHLKDKYIKINSYSGRKGRSTTVRGNRNQMYLYVGNILSRVQPSSKGDSGLRLDMTSCVAPQEATNEPKRNTEKQ